MFPSFREGFEVHKSLMNFADDLFSLLIQENKDNVPWFTSVRKTRTAHCSSLFLGRGAKGRNHGAFQKLAYSYFNYIHKEKPSFSFERYHDFILFDEKNWYSGQRQILLIAEIETNPKELLGEFSELVHTKSQYKYLFIRHHDNILKKLNKFCHEHEIIDWDQTQYFVIEIPGIAKKPSQWKCYNSSLDNGHLIFQDFDSN